MSVSRSTEADISVEELQAFDDFVVQTINLRSRFDVGNMGPNDETDGTLGNPGNLPPIVGGLERDRIAELVAVEQNYLTTKHLASGGTGTTPGTADLELQWGIEDSESSIFTPATSHGVNRDPDDDGLTEINNAFASKQPTTRHRLIWKDEATIGQGFNDTTNGSGGGGYQQQSQQFNFVSYRELFGHGPLYYPGDVIQGASAVSLHNWENEPVTINGDYRLYWDVYQTQDPDVRDIIGKG